MTDKERISWAHDQMNRLGVPDDHQMVVARLLEVYWAYPVVKHLDEPSNADLLRLFTELAQNHVLVPDDPDGDWVDARPGGLVIRDTVRVRRDAYTGEAGLAHNSRVGTIVAIRSGDIHVRYTDDKEPKFDTVRHSPFSLEKRI